MIVWLAALLGISGPTVIELPNPSSRYITFQAIVRVPSFSGSQQALAQVVDDLLLNSSENFNEDQLRGYSSLAGEAMRCTLSADHFRIQLEMPREDMGLGAEILADVLRKPRFEQDALSADLLAASTRPASVWAELVLPFRLDFKSITRQAVLDFFGKTFVPTAATITIGGAFQVGEAEAALERQLNDWQAPKPVPTYGRKTLPEPPPALLAKHSFPISTIELYGPTYAGADDSFPAQLLVATALGVGKASSMHKVLREKLGLSYEQAAMIEPTPAGFATHLVMMQASNGRESQVLETMRSALQDDVTLWTEATRTRALGMARAYLECGAPASPLFFDFDRVIGSSLEEQTFLQGYWRMKTGEKWDVAKLLGLMSQVSLDEMKSLAASFLKDAQGSIILGK